MPGSIIFKPLEVNLTQDTTLFGKPEPYCIVSLGDQKIQTQIGEIIQSPQEEDYLALQVEDEPTCLVELKDHDNLSLGENIGVCRVSLEEIESMGTVRKWYPIYDKEDHPTGKILLEATYTPENQTPTDIPEDNLSGIEELDEDTMESKEAQQEMQIDGESKEGGVLDEQLSPKGFSGKKGSKKKTRYLFDQVGSSEDKDMEEEECKEAQQEMQIDGESKEGGVLDEQLSPKGFSGKKGSKKKTRYLFDQVGSSEDKDMEEEECKVDQSERKLKSGGEYRNNCGWKGERKSPILDGEEGGQELQEIQMDKTEGKGGQTLSMKWDV